MNKEAVYQQIVAIILDSKGSDFEVTPATSLNDSIAEDSVEIMEFVLSLEDAFGIEISDSDIESFRTVEDITNYIFSISK